MLVIRLFRAGKRNQPFFKIVVTDKKNPPKGGRFVEELGFVNPLTKKNKIDGERAKYWISKGAKPSDTIYNLLIREKVLEGKKIPVHKKSKNQEAKAPESPVATPEAKLEKVVKEEAVEQKPEEIKPEENPASN